MKERKILFRRAVIAIILLLICSLICAIIYDRATVGNFYNMGEKNLAIPIFVYHDIVKDKSAIEYDYMQTTAQRFEEQIEGLKKVGYDFISYEDLEKYYNKEKRIKKLSCLVTFDDGYEGVYENAFPIIKKHNVPISIYVVTDKMGKPGVMNWEQAKEMQDSGLVTIASHSTNHPEFTSLSTEDAVNNVENSYKEIEKKMGKQKRKVFTYPYGLHKKEQNKALKEKGYIQNLTDNKINKSNKLDLAGLHRCYPLNDSVEKMVMKIMYRSMRYN